MSPKALFSTSKKIFLRGVTKRIARFPFQVIKQLSLSSTPNK
jgi:hypothetical protein